MTALKDFKLKTLYIDMDGVVANFWDAIKFLDPTIEDDSLYPDRDLRGNMVDQICSKHPHVFRFLKPIEGSIEAVNDLFQHFDIYFLSTPMWCVPQSFMDKRIWLHEHFGDKAEKRLILTHRKDLNVGHFLIDDRIAHGVDRFTGKHIHYGQPEFPTWTEVVDYLHQNKYK
jgi:5'-nucleotidase